MCNSQIIYLIEKIEDNATWGFRAFTDAEDAKTFVKGCEERYGSETVSFSFKSLALDGNPLDTLFDE